MASVTIQVTIEVDAENEGQFFQEVTKECGSSRFVAAILENGEVVKANYDEPDSGVLDNREEL